MSTSATSTPPHSTTPTPGDRLQLLSIGTECSHPACHLHDFLPILCPACHQPFCQPHFLPSTHACSAPLPPSMVDRIAPQCPLCNTITPFPAGSTDPNDAVERHILQGTCVGLPGGAEAKKAELRRRKDRGEVCWRKGCTKSLVVKMQCLDCRRDFCPAHRDVKNHACEAAGSSSRGPIPGPSGSTAGMGKPTTKAAMARLLPNKAASAPASRQAQNPPPPRSPVVPAQASSSTSTPLDAKAAAATAAMKRFGQEIKAPVVKHKTDKRAQAEHSSTLQALKARHEKGLLSPAEEVKYAEMLGKGESARRKGEGGKGKGDCCIA